MQTRRQTLQEIACGRWDKRPEASAFGPDWRAAAVLRFCNVPVLVNCDKTARYVIGRERITRGAMWSRANEKMIAAKLPAMKRTAS